MTVPDDKRNSAAAVVLRRAFPVVRIEDEELTLAYRDGLVEELVEMFERFAAAHRRASTAELPQSLAA